MLEETILGIAVGMVILLFFGVNYWYSARAHEIERDAQSEDD